MSLQGSVSTMSFPDLFQWIGNAGKSGCLRIEHGRTTTRIEWSSGRVVRCVTDDPPQLLGQFLVFHGVVAEDALRRAMAEQASTGRGLPQILVQSGALTTADLDRLVSLKAQEAILGLFESREAHFVFEDGDSAGPNAMSLDLDVQDLLLQGMKRLDDKERIRTVFKGPGTVVAHSARQPAPDRLGDWPTREIYRSIDGRRTIEEIALKVHGTEFRVAMILLDLYNDDLIRVCGLREPSAEPSPTAAEPTAVQASGSEAALDALLDRIPVPRRPRHEIAGEGITAEEDFLLSLTDGAWDVRSLTWVAPMRVEDVLAALRRLEQRGLIELRAAAPHPAV